MVMSDVNGRQRTTCAHVYLLGKCMYLFGLHHQIAYLFLNYLSIMSILA